MGKINSELIKLPFVSVIVPVYNSENTIEECLKALLNQTYPKENFDIIIVDNGSTDMTPEIVTNYPVTLLFEREIQGPYAARNKGLEAVEGEIVAFTDSDCIPYPSWIENAVSALEKNDVDLVGGRVEFMFDNPKGSAEIYDSLVNLEMEQKIADKGVAKTGNLIVRKNIFDEIGLFPHNVRSGGDVWWTGKASEAGFKIEYYHDVAIKKRARKFLPLIKKQFRVGKGKGRNLLLEENTTRIIKELIKGFRPLSDKVICELIDRRGQEGDYDYRFKLRVMSFLCRSAMNFGRIYYMILYLLKLEKLKI